jgi:hypothetical protein
MSERPVSFEPAPVPSPVRSLIAASGHYKKGSDRILSQLSGFDHFLAKPVDPETLIGLVKRYRDGALAG